jgi:hypothetical protein
MNKANSGYMFSLASECGIPINPGEQWPVEDEDFITFKSKYLEWSDRRDKHISDYLSTTSNLFRVYLPYNDRSFYLASQIVWYLDEIIIRDPVRIMVQRSDKTIESDKLETIQLLQSLSRFRPVIDNGYILFAGSYVLQSIETDIYSDIANSLIEHPEIYSALKHATYYGYTTRKDSQGQDTSVYQLKLDSGGLFGFGPMTIPGGKSVATPAIKIGERLPYIPQEQFQKIVKIDLKMTMKGTYLTEIKRTLSLIDMAHSLGAAIVFDRPLDQIILSHAGLKLSPEKQMATCGILNLSLPFIKGIPPERIAEIRDEMPMAFLDFRSKLFEIVSEGLKYGITASDELRIYVEKEITPQIRLLDSELNGAIKKAKILYLGYPLVSGLGILTGAIFSAPITALIGLGVAGTIGTVKTYADDQETKEKAKGHPFYFLWKVKRN